MEMEVEVCHRVNGPFFSPFSSSFFFFVFLFLLAGRLVSWPSGLHGCISLGHEPLPFCRALSLSLSPPHFLHFSPSSFCCSAFLRSRQGRDAGPLEQQKLFSTEWNLVGERAFRHPARIVIYHDSGKQVRYTGWCQIRVRSSHRGVVWITCNRYFFYRKLKKN